LTVSYDEPCCPPLFSLFYPVLILDSPLTILTDSLQRFCDLLLGLGPLRSGRTCSHVRFPTVTGLPRLPSFLVIQRRTSTEFVNLSFFPFSWACAVLSCSSVCLVFGMLVLSFLKPDSQPPRVPGRFARSNPFS